MADREQGVHEPAALSVAIRLATIVDVERVGQLLHDCLSGLRADGVDQWDEVYPSRATILADVDAGTLYVASDTAGDLTGALTLNAHQDPEYATVPWTLRGASVAVVHRLMVHPARSGRGLARTLMEFAERRATGEGCGVIRLDAFAANPRAMRLYAGRGYRDAGEVRFRKGVFRCFEKALPDPGLPPAVQR